MSATWREKPSKQVMMQVLLLCWCTRLNHCYYYWLRDLEQIIVVPWLAYWIVAFVWKRMMESVRYRVKYGSIHRVLFVRDFLPRKHNNHGGCRTSALSEQWDEHLFIQKLNDQKTVRWLVCAYTSKVRITRQI